MLSEGCEIFEDVIFFSPARSPPAPAPLALVRADMSAEIVEIASLEFIVLSTVSERILINIFFNDTSLINIVTYDADGGH
jgi:hypothetical protein